jgi:hypothetical protein
MAIGQSKLHEMLRKHRLMSEAVAWLEVFDSATKKQVLDWIRKDQLTAKGIDADGNVIGYYSQVTEMITRGKKQAGSHYTLDDTGAFYRSMYVTVFRSSLEIDANGDKGEEDLFEKYGQKIIGLTEENMGNLRQVVKEKYIAIAKKILFGTR